MVVENYGNSELAKRYGVTRYPAIFVNDILVAKPKDFGFYGKGEGGGDGRYTPWKDPKSYERFRVDLKKMIEIVLANDEDELRQVKERAKEDAGLEIARLPEFTVQDLSGKPITSKDLAGRVVLVEFWATWCPPCRGTLSWLGQLQKQYGDRLTVLAIAVESDEADVKEVAKTLNLPIQWALGTPEVARSFGDIAAVPTLFLFDAKGETIDVFFGATPDLHENAEHDIESTLSSK